MDYRYTLDRSPRKHICPNCGKKRFVRYVDAATNIYLPEPYGRCDREQKCAYHLNPYHDSYATDNAGTGTGRQWTPPPPEPVTYMSFDNDVRSNLKAYGRNNFVRYLVELCGQSVADDLCRRYHIGTSKNWNNAGATIFWYVDAQARVIGGKVMLYDAVGHRVKEPFDHITWVHTLKKLKGFTLGKCLFGEHLLSRFPQMPVMLFESEKTALIAAAYYPDWLCLAVGGKGNPSPERCAALAGRVVRLMPDLGAFNDWNEKAEVLRRRIMATWEVSDFLEQHAPAGHKGYDLADYLIKYKLSEWLTIPDDALEPKPPTATPAPGWNDAPEIQVMPSADHDPTPDALTRMSAQNPALSALVAAFDLEVEPNPAPIQKVTDGDVWTIYEGVPDDAPLELRQLAKWGKTARWFLPRPYNRNGWTVNGSKDVKDLKGLFEARLSFAASRRIFGVDDLSRYHAAVADMQAIQAIVG